MSIGGGIILEIVAPESCRPEEIGIVLVLGIVLTIIRSEETLKLVGGSKGTQ
jgi:hypothetical protein